MKKTLLLATLLIAAGANAQVVESGFESWTDGQPDGWNGIRTNLPAAAITQATENVHGGDFAVRLARTAGTHQRFTTQDVEVTDGTTYTVTFWVRGTGQVRVGLYDARPGGSSGYAPYTAYTAVTSEWAQVTRTISAANTSDQAQFIISLHSTVEPEHMVIDDVTITASGAIPTVSIYDIQYTTNPSGDSPYNGQQVKTSGIVTAVDAFSTSGEPQNIYYLQDGSGPWRGIYVYDFVDNNNIVAVGDQVEFTATVTEYFNLTELTSITGFSIIASGQPLPAPVVINTGDLSSEALESVLVRVEGATCTEAPSGANFGKYKVDDGSGDAVVGKEIHTTEPPPSVGQVMNITGVVSFGFGEFNLQPRSASDIETATGMAQVGVLGTVGLYPNPANAALTLDLSAINGRTKFTISDATGRVVITDMVNAERSTIDVSTLTNGMYVLTLRNGAEVWSSRVQVQH